MQRHNCGNAQLRAEMASANPVWSEMRVDKSRASVADLAMKHRRDRDGAVEPASELGNDGKSSGEVDGFVGKRKVRAWLAQTNVIWLVVVQCPACAAIKVSDTLSNNSL
ncbi:MAG TPA: hypothetical protein VFA99_17350 [Acidobacteriaceae bacterium]|nr:hypothetical protein [Acidobacteriaceae bacterium]